MGSLQNKNIWVHANGVLKIIFVSLSISLTPFCFAGANLLCSKVFSSTPNQKSFLDFVTQRYFIVDSTNSSIGFNGEGVRLKSTVYYGRSESTHNQLVAVWKGSPSPNHSQNGYEPQFVESVKESIELVLKSYGERRNWSPEFRQKLFDQAISDSNRSTYINFRVHDTITNLYLLKGTLKIIEASEKRNELLPVDGNLEIKIPFNAGVKFELGNFTIDKQFNKEAFSELLVQLMIHAATVSRQPEHMPNQMTYFTYADALSYRMYASLGFKPVPGFEKGINKDGVNWIPMGISTKSILEIPATMTKSRKYWEQHVLNELLDKFMGITSVFAQRFQPSHWSLSNFDVYLHRHENDETKGKNIRALVLISKFAGAGNFVLPIPFDFLPLKNNSTTSFSNGRFVYQYLNGVLTILMDHRTIFHIKADSNLEDIQTISVGSL